MLQSEKICCRRRSRCRSEQWISVPPNKKYVARVVAAAFYVSWVEKEELSKPRRKTRLKPGNIRTHPSPPPTQISVVQVLGLCSSSENKWINSSRQSAPLLLQPTATNCINCERTSSSTQLLQRVEYVLIIASRARNVHLHASVAVAVEVSDTPTPTHTQLTQTLELQLQLLTHTHTLDTDTVAGLTLGETFFCVHSYMFPPPPSSCCCCWLFATKILSLRFCLFPSICVCISMYMYMFTACTRKR